MKKHHPGTFERTAIWEYQNNRSKKQCKTRLIITLKIAIVVVEILSKKLNLTAFSGLNRKANKTGDAIIIMTNTNFVFSYPNLYKAGK